MSIQFYKNGLHFACTNCGKCCRIADGIVHVSSRDAMRLARFLHITVEDFLQKYTHSEYRHRVINDFPNGDCIFFRDGQGCGVYPARPEQCRTWPFWHENLVSQETWNHAAAGCPGMNAGKLYSASEIESIMNGEIDTDGNSI